MLLTVRRGRHAGEHSWEGKIADVLMMGGESAGPAWAEGAVAVAVGGGSVVTALPPLGRIRPGLNLLKMRHGLSHGDEWKAGGAAQCRQGRSRGGGGWDAAGK